MTVSRSLDSTTLHPGNLAVERRYQEAITGMTPQEKIARAFSLYGEVWEMLAHQVRQETPGLSEWETRRRVAMRMYLSDPEAQRLLARMKP